MTADDIVSQFASSLDAEDYSATRALLSEICQYESPTGLLVGPDAIVQSYQGHGDSARERFDSIEYSHEISPLDDGWYQIEFIDRVCTGSRSHVYRCQQRVRLAAGQIAQIMHAEIPGERDRLNAFLQILE